MTKKHYTKIAELIRAAKDGNLTDPEMVVNEIAIGLVDILKDDNSMFDPRKFMDACGVQRIG